MRLLRQAWLLARNDLRQEARDRELGLTAGFFAVVVLSMLGLSFAALKPETHPIVVPGFLWLAVAFVGTLTLTRVFDREREADTLRALLIAPVDRLAIYLAKACITQIVLMGTCLIIVPGLMLMFPDAIVFWERPGITVVLVFFGCLGYTAVGTLFAAGLATQSGKNVLLSVILYPITSPVLMFALVATRALLERHPDTATYVGQLVALDVILLAMGAAFFETVLVGTGRRRTEASAGAEGRNPSQSPERIRSR